MLIQLINAEKLEQPYITTVILCYIMYEICEDDTNKIICQPKN